MTDFHDKGFAVLELMDPRFAADVWRDIDKDEIRKLLDTVSDKPWKSLENFPKTRSLFAFSREVDNSMWKCWERYGKKSLKPKIVEQDLRVFLRTQNAIKTSSVKEYVMVFIPFINVSQHEGLPTLMEGSHRNKNGGNNKSYDPIVQPGHALMFDARLIARIPPAGGGALLARVYDMTGL